VISSLNYISPSENYYFTSELYLPFAAYAFPPGPALEPVLAKGWSSNGNYTLWVWNLKSGLKWDDGSPLNATDLWFTFKIENATNGFSGAPQVKSFTVLNSTAIQVQTKVPEPNLVYFYCQQTNSYILPYKTYKNIPLSEIQSNFTNFNNIVASGPFVIRNYTQGANPIIFTANPYYYKGSPFMSQLYVYSFTSLASELAAYKTGQINALWAYGASSVIAPLIQNVTGQHLIKIVPGAEMGIYFNMAKYPYNMTQFRQALAYSTNRTQINAVVNSPNLPLVDYDNLISDLENQIGLNGSTIPTYSYNLTKASDLLTSIGLKKVNGFWTFANGTGVTLNIITADQGYGETPTSQVVNSQWKTAGFNVFLRVLSYTSYLTAETTQKGWQVALELDNPGYYPSGLGNLLGATYGGVSGGGGVSGAMNLTLRPSKGLANYNFSAINSILGLAQKYPLNSPQSNSYARQAAPLLGQTVPFIPLYVIYNWMSLPDNYYWGTQSDLSGIYNTQALVAPQFWYDALWTVKPINAATSTSSAITTTAPSSTSVVTTTTTVTPSSDNTPLYIGIAVVVVIIAALALAVRRRGPKASPTIAKTT
jgi:peptide/nickel transport system substrate-binding protein